MSRSRLGDARSARQTTEQDLARLRASREAVTAATAERIRLLAEHGVVLTFAKAHACPICGTDTTEPITIGNRRVTYHVCSAECMGALIESLARIDQSGHLRGES